MSFNYLKDTRIGQSAEEFTSNVANNDLKNAQYSILQLTTFERLSLATELKTPNMVVYDKEQKKWYSWKLVNGSYTWALMSFVDNFFMYNVQKREGHITLSADEVMVDIVPYVGEFSPDNEVLLVALDGTILIEGVHYDIVFEQDSIYVVSKGMWYKGQQLHIMVLYAGDDVSELTELIEELQDEIRQVEDLVDTTNEMANENKQRIENIVNGTEMVEVARFAQNLMFSEPALVVEDVFNTRITAKDNNEISDDVKSQTNAIITKVEGQTVIQRLENAHEEEVLTTDASVNIKGETVIQKLENAHNNAKLTTDSYVNIFGESIKEDGLIRNSQPVSLLSRSANLFNNTKGSFSGNDYIITETGFIRQAGKSTDITYEIDTISNQEYTLSMLKDEGNRVFIVDVATDTTIFVSPFTSTTVSITFTALGNKTLLRFNTQSSYRENATEWSNIMLNKGTEALPYQPYATTDVELPDLTIHFPYGMCSLPDGTKDELGVKRIGGVVFNGSENWVRYAAQYTEDTAVWAISYNDAGISNTISSLNNTSNAISNFFPQGNYISVNEERFSLVTSGSYLYVRINKSRLIPYGYIEATTSTHTPAFKSWLSNNNLMILYKLANPILTGVQFVNAHIYDNGELILLDGDYEKTLGDIDILPKYTAVLEANKTYYVSALLSDYTNAEITNGVDKVALTQNGVKFTPPTNGTYWLSFVKDGINTIAKPNILELVSDLVNKTVSELADDFKNRYLETGINNSRPAKIVSNSSNLLNVSNGTYTMYGVTVTINNGTITLNGTASTNFFIKLTNGLDVYTDRRPEWLNQNIGLKKGYHTFKYTNISGTSGTSISFNLRGKDSDAVVSQINTTSSQVNTVNINEDVAYAYIYITSGVIFDNLTFTLQVNEGMNALSYQPYARHEIALPDLSEHFPNGLGRLPNGVYDDVGVKRIGRIVFNGSASENYVLDQILTNTYEFMIDIPSDSVKDLGVNQAISDKLPHIKNYSLDAEHFYFGATKIYIFIDKNKLVNTNISTLKTYLQSNPLTIYYQLSTPIPTGISPIQVPVYDKGSIVLLDDNNLETLGETQVIPKYRVRCEANKDYFFSCKLTDETGARITNGSADFPLANGYVKFKPLNAGEYWLECIKDGINKISRPQWFELNGLDNKTNIQLYSLFVKKFYPLGIYNSNVSKLTSSGDNWFKITQNNIIGGTLTNKNYVKTTQKYFSSSYRARAAILEPIWLDVSANYTAELRINGTGGITVYVFNINNDVIGQLICDSSSGTNYHSINISGKEAVKFVIGTYNTQNLFEGMLELQLKSKNNATAIHNEYVEEIINIPQVELCSLPNGVRDELTTRKVGKLVFNGNEIWNFVDVGTDTLRFNIKAETPLINLWVNNAISNHFPLAATTYQTNVEGFQGTADGFIFIRILKNRLSGYQDGWTNTQKTNAFKSWLSQNNLEIYYQLANPEIVEIPYWRNTYRAWNYGKEELDGIARLTIKYFPDPSKQIETNRQLIEEIIDRLNRAGIPL